MDRLFHAGRGIERQLGIAVHLVDVVAELDDAVGHGIRMAAGCACGAARTFKTDGAVCRYLVGPCMAFGITFDGVVLHVRYQDRDRASR